MLKCFFIKQKDSNNYLHPHRDAFDNEYLLKEGKIGAALWTDNQREFIDAILKDSPENLELEELKPGKEKFSTRIKNIFR